jgi:predicted dehydrogenase
MKILFIGLGSIGQRHLRNLRRLVGDSVQVIAYRVQREAPVLNDLLQVQEGVDLAERYDVLEFDDLDEALNEKPDIAFITNPTSQHIETALRAARAGCHLFIEKPLGSSLEGVEELVDLVASKRLVSTVAYQLRFHPGLKQVHNWLQKKRIGSLLSASLRQGEYLPDSHPYEDYRIGYAARKKLGGGVIFMHIHEFDYALWLFGLPSRVMAIGGKYSELEIDVEDAVTVLMECEYEGRSLPVTLMLDYLQSPPERSCIIVGDQGRIQWDYYAGQAILTLRDGETELMDFKGFDRNTMFEEELKQFLDAVAGKASPLVDLQSGVESLKIALSAKKDLSI